MGLTTKHVPLAWHARRRANEVSRGTASNRVKTLRPPGQGTESGTQPAVVSTRHGAFRSYSLVGKPATIAVI